jgi:hypothetical protein
MARNQELLNHYRAELAAMREDIAACEAGQWNMNDLRNGQRIDVTAEYVADLRQRADDLEKVIRASENDGD